MIKNIFSSLIVMITILVIAGCGNDTSENGNNKVTSTANNSDSKVYELDFNTQTPSTHAYNKNAIEPWAKLVEEKTNGRVKINVYESGALGKNGTAYDDLKNGVYDIGYILSSSVKDTELFPLTLGDLPFAFSDNTKLVAVMNSVKEKYLADSFPNELKFMAFSATDPYQIVTKDPVKSVDDLKNMRLRIGGDDNIELAKQWGATPVTMELNELYQSLERGVIDGTSYTAVGSTGLSLFEVAPYITRLDMNVFQLVYVMNADSFNQLPDDIQVLFEDELNPMLSEMILQAYNDEADSAIKKYQENGGEVIIPNKSEKKKFTKPVEVVWENWINKANEKGLPGNEILDFFKDKIEEEGGELPY